MCRCVNDKDRQNGHLNPLKAMVGYLQEKIKTGNKKIEKK
jgi:predicted nucleotide-binding protein (sugar kinase/HSP70/actin superfamily)